MSVAVLCGHQLPAELVCSVYRLRMFLCGWFRFIKGVFPCHHGMARPQVADGGDGLQIWRIAANILNRLSGTPDKGWSSSLGIERGANNSSPQKHKLVTKDSKKPQTWTVRFHKMLGSCSVAAQLAAYQEGLGSVSK
jgi:hypothetical protein